jgi:hypothetical protein
MGAGNMIGVTFFASGFFVLSEYLKKDDHIKDEEDWELE